MIIPLEMVTDLNKTWKRLTIQECFALDTSWSCLSLPCFWIPVCASTLSTSEVFWWGTCVWENRKYDVIDQRYSFVEVNLLHCTCIIINDMIAQLVTRTTRKFMTLSCVLNIVNNKQWITEIHYRTSETFKLYFFEIITWETARQHYICPCIAWGMYFLFFDQ